MYQCVKIFTQLCLYWKNLTIYNLYLYQQLTIEGTIGKQMVVLDDIALKPRGCGECIKFDTCRKDWHDLPNWLGRISMNVI